MTTKIAFANTLARICEQLPGANVDEVTSALGLDSRIGPKYLRGAISYGGPCFPRDNLALALLGRRLGAPALVAEATDANREGITSLADTVMSRLPQGGTAGPRAVVQARHRRGRGVARTASRSDARRCGIDVVAYDPPASRTPGMPDGSDVRFVDGTDQCIQQADVVVIATAWQEFAAIEPAVFERPDVPRVVIDCWRLLDSDRLEGIATYVALGQSLAEGAVVG